MTVLFQDSFRTAVSQFPGNEAVRVSTPPMDEDTADGRPRGFFSSLTPPASKPDSASSTTTPSPPVQPKPNHRGYQRSSVSSQPREWWDPMPAPRTRRQQRPVQRDFEFEFDVPEHLLSSPLCPANSRHKSGGTGLCVYHGRRRTKTILRDADTQNTASQLTGGSYQ
ncbi:hypothetical protein E4U54_008562 [Claviceps lovelessii]|nr:hypothetical protein E4U54_008562 [Claviceps lovelessii]